MKKIIKQILKEDRQEQFLNKIILLMKDEYPIFKKLDDYGFNLSEEEMNYVFSGIFGEPVTVRLRFKKIYDKNRNGIYHESSTGFWRKWTFDENGNQIYHEHSECFWEKSEYDQNNNKIYYERSDGYWYKREFDENGNEIYHEDSDGEIYDYR